MSLVRQQPFKAATGNTHSPSDNTAAIVTIAAVSGKRHYLTGIHCSFDAAPAATTLKVENGAGTTVWEVDITSVGPMEFLFLSPMEMTVNTALVVTLGAGGSSVGGNVAVSAYTDR